MITVCMTQNECGILEGFIFHIMPNESREGRREKGRARTGQRTEAECDLKDGDRDAV